MKTLETPLIKSISKKELSALGQKQVDRFIRKACEANNTHRYSKEAKDLVDQVTSLVRSLIFDHNYTKDQISFLQRNIKVNNNILELPSMS